MKIEEYLKSLPDEILTGEDIQIPARSLVTMFKFADLNKDDVFYHLGCNDECGIEIASREFHVKKAIGIDIDRKKIEKSRKNIESKKIKNCKLIHSDVITSNFDDATVILFWFTDPVIINKMTKQFKKLKEGCRIITIWGPLRNCLPHKVLFPYIINKIPLIESNDIRKQIKLIFDVNCIDFPTAWKYAEKYIKALSSNENRFLTIIQALTIWINARNFNVSCDKDIPEPVKKYIKILREHFNIEIEHLLK